MTNRILQLKPFPQIQKLTTSIIRRAKILRRSVHFVGAFASGLIVSPLFTDAGFYELIVGVMMLCFLFSIRDINNHFNITWTNVTLKIHPSLDVFPPLNRWLVPLDRMEISPELYEELADLKGVVQSDFIEEKISHILEYRKGVITYYDIANIAMMAECLIRSRQFSINK